MPQAFQKTNGAPRPLRKWWILVAIGLSLFMGTIDGSIVNVALPTLTAELKTDFATIQWVVLSFLLGLTVLMLSMGRLGDMIGKKKVYASGLVLFVMGSALCGMAANVYQLISFRLVQSVGAAMMMALGVAIVAETWPTHERGKAIGISGGIISLGIAAGPALGGVILQHFSWRWLFFVNLPIGLVALVLVLLVVPPLKPKTTGERFDLLGAFLIGAALLSLSLSMTLGQRLGFDSWRFWLLVGISVVAFTAFIGVERTVRYPMIRLALFRNIDFSLNLLVGFLSFVSIAAVVLILPFYLQLVMGLEAQRVGLLMSVVPIVLGILGPTAGTLSDRFGTRRISLVGLAILLSGYMSLSYLPLEGTALVFVLLLLPIGVGMAVFQSPNNTAILNTSPRDQLGVASGILSMTRTLGQSVGIALLGAFFAVRLQVYSVDVGDISSAEPVAIVRAMHDEFLVAGALIALGLGLALWRGWSTRGRARAQ